MKCVKCMKCMTCIECTKCLKCCPPPLPPNFLSKLSWAYRCNMPEYQKLRNTFCYNLCLGRRQEIQRIWNYGGAATSVSTWAALLDLSGPSRSSRAFSKAASRWFWRNTEWITDWGPVSSVGGLSCDWIVFFWLYWISIWFFWYLFDYIGCMVMLMGEKQKIRVDFVY